MKKIIIAGGNGFLGNHFIQWLLSNKPRKYDLVNLDFSKKASHSNHSLPYIKCDLGDLEAVKEVLKEIKPDYIINFTGKYGSGSIAKHINSNVVLSANILEALHELKMDIQKVVLIGSAAEYGDNPQMPLSENSTSNFINHYGFSKHLQSALAQYYYKQFQTPVIIARTFNIIGPGISPNLSIGAFIKKIRNNKINENLNVGNLQSYRDFLDIGDACNAFYRILMSGQAGKIYNVCSGEKTKMQNILDTLIEISGKKINVLSQKSRSKEISISYGDNTQLKEELHWQQKISLKDSLKKAYLN